MLQNCSHTVSIQSHWTCVLWLGLAIWRFLHEVEATALSVPTVVIGCDCIANCREKGFVPMPRVSRQFYRGDAWVNVFENL